MLCASIHKSIYVSSLRLKFMAFVPDTLSATVSASLKRSRISDDRWRGAGFVEHVADQGVHVVEMAGQAALDEEGFGEGEADL